MARKIRLFGGKYQAKEEGSNDWTDIDRDTYKKYQADSEQEEFDATNDDDFVLKKEEEADLPTIKSKNGVTFNVKRVRFDNGFSFDYTMNDETEIKTANYDEFNELISKGD